MLEDSERIKTGDRVTIYRRGKKKLWCADFSQDGEHRRQSLRTRNRKVAADRAMKLSVSVADNSYAKPIPLAKLTDVVDQYIGYLEAENRSRKTLVKYRGILNSFVA